MTQQPPPPWNDQHGRLETTSMEEHFIKLEEKDDHRHDVINLCEDNLLTSTNIPPSSYASLIQPRSFLWSFKETQSLISILKEDAHKSYRDITKNNYEFFSEELLRRGHTRDAYQCKVKIKNMKRLFKAAEMNKAKKGTFHEQLKEIFDNNTGSSDNNSAGMSGPRESNCSSTESNNNNNDLIQFDFSHMLNNPNLPQQEQPNRASVCKPPDSIGSSSNHFSPFRCIIEDPSTTQLTNLSAQRSIPTAPYNRFKHINGGNRGSIIMNRRQMKRLQPIISARTTLFNSKKLNAEVTTVAAPSRPSVAAVVTVDASTSTTAPIDEKLNPIAFVEQMMDTLTDKLLKYQAESEQRLLEFESRRLSELQEYEERRRKEERSHELKLIETMFRTFNSQQQTRAETD